MLESGSSGSVRGASSNGRPYRELDLLLPCERAGSTRKRSSAGGVGCTRTDRSGSEVRTRRIDPHLPFPNVGWRSAWAPRAAVCDLPLTASQEYCVGNGLL